MSDIQNKLVIDGQGFGSGQCTLGVNSSEYRDRLIVAHSIEGATCDVRDFGYQITWRNGCVQDSKGNALTPQLDCSFVLATSFDHGTDTYYSGWAMLGDFIILYQPKFSWESDDQRESGVRLWDSEKHADIAGANISLEEAWKLATKITKECDRGDFGIVPRPSIHQETYEGVFQNGSIRAVRLIDALNSQGDSYDDEVMEGRGKALNIICDGSLDAAQGAARIYMDGFGWRWLFPCKPGGSSKSLTELIQTDSLNDWKLMKPLLKDLTEEERTLVQRHFLYSAYKGWSSDSAWESHDSLFNFPFGGQAKLLEFEKNGSENVCHPDLLQEVKDTFLDLQKQEV